MEIYYVNSKGEKIYFDRLPYLMLTDTNVFNYEWSYDIKNNNLYNIRRSLPTKDVSIVITGKDYEDYKKNILYLYETLDTDAINQTFGRLYFGDYYLQCFCAVSDKPDKYIETKRTTANAEPALHSKSVKPHRQTFLLRSGKASQTDSESKRWNRSRAPNVPTLLGETGPCMRYSDATCQSHNRDLR